MRKKWNCFLYALCALMLVCSFLPDVEVWAENLGELSYTDGQGNEFTYTVDNGNAVIKGITVSGQALVIPESIGGVPVAAVRNDDYSCVVSNPETEIDSLYINCGRIGAYAFSGIKVGELTIGEDVCCLEESLADTGSTLHCWEQFYLATVGKLNLRARNLVLEHTRPRMTLSNILGPFYRAVVGELEIGDDVEVIPEAFLYEAELHQDRLELHVPEIGALAFADGDVRFDELVIGSEVSIFHEGEFSTDDQHLWKQFAKAVIGTLRYQAPDLTLEHINGAGLVNNVGPAFKGAKITGLELGDDVEAIPEYFLYQAELSMSSLELHVPEIGAYAFSGEKISFGELVIGSEVERFTESFASAGNRHEWNQFADTSIGTLKFYVPELTMEHVAASGLSVAILPPFARAKITSLEIGDDVKAIPEYFLYKAQMSLGGLELHVPKIGAYAFSGEKIQFGELVIGSEVEKFTESFASTGSRHEWSQFADTTIGTLKLYAPELAMEHMAGSGVSISVFPPFAGAAVSNLEIGSDVEVIPECFLYNAKMSLGELELHVSEIGAYAFSGENISIDTLTIGKEVSVFAEYCFSDSTTHHWGTFAKSKIGHLVYAAEHAVVDNTAVPYGNAYTNIYAPPFMQAQVAGLTITGDVTCIPDYFLYKAEAELDEVYLDMPVIGALAFMGTDIAIRSLTIGEHVTTFSRVKYDSSSSYLWQQFEGAALGDVYFNAVSCGLEGAAPDGSYYHGPFYKAKVDTLHIGSAVEVVPAYCFNEVILEQDELEIHAGTVGEYAFNSENVSVGSLTIGTEVEAFAGKSSGGMMYFRQFAGNKIGTLYYEPAAAETGAGCYGGVFNKAEIGEVLFGDGVEAIPNYLFYNAVIDFGDFILDIPTIGYYSFYGDKISFSTLTLGEHVACFPVNSSNYNRAFYYNTIGCLRINTPSIQLLSVHGPFSASVKIGTLEIGEGVVFLDSRTFYNVSVTDCYVYPVNASEEHNAQTLTASQLIKCENLYIHYNSDFKPLFVSKAANKEWMCVGCYEQTYGELVYDEDSDEYLVEIIRHCPVCGHDEAGTEALDDSYSLHICIPLETALSYVSENKAFEGSAEFYVYGTLGNAYAGVRLSVDTDGEGYGTAVLDGTAVDIAAFLVAGFESGEEAAFTAEQVAENTGALADGEDAPNVDVLNVSVSGYAFYLSGPGNYRIPLPIVVECIGR